MMVRIEIFFKMRISKFQSWISNPNKLPNPTLESTQLNVSNRQRIFLDARTPGSILREVKLVKNDDASSPSFWNIIKHIFNLPTASLIWILGGWMLEDSAAWINASCAERGWMMEPQESSMLPPHSRKKAFDEVQFSRGSNPRDLFTGSSAIA